MTELDQAIVNAFASQGLQADVNKVYLVLLRTLFFVPVKKEKSIHPEEPFSPLFAKVDEKFFMLAFDSLERLTTWAGDQFEQIAFVELSGIELIAGINEQVYLGVNLGTDYYKEFSPDEIKRLKMAGVRIEQLKAGI